MKEFEIHTRENMSSALREELERIEHSEFCQAMKLWIDEGFVISYCTFGPRNTRGMQNENPFEVEFFSEHLGSIQKIDFREDMIEKYADNPEKFKEQIIASAKAFRAFADELEALLK